MAATKEAILAKEHEPDLEVTIFFLDLRAFGKDFDRYCERAKSLGVRYIRSFISRTYEMPDTHNLRLVHAGPGIEQVEEEFDMVVLSLGLEPSSSLREQAERIGIELNPWGFADTRELIAHRAEAADHAVLVMGPELAGERFDLGDGAGDGDPVADDVGAGEVDDAADEEILAVGLEGVVGIVAPLGPGAIEGRRGAGQVIPAAAVVHPHGDGGGHRGVDEVAEEGSS